MQKLIDQNQNNPSEILPNKSQAIRFLERILFFYPTDTDRYGRTIAKIFYADDKYLSAEIIKAGLGWWYHQYSDNKELGKMQDVAKVEGLGLWNDNNPISPYDWRQ